MHRAQKYSASAVVVALSAKWVVPFAEKLGIIASVAIKQGFRHIKEIAHIEKYLEISVMIVNDHFRYICHLCCDLAWRKMFAPHLKDDTCQLFLFNRQMWWLKGVVLKKPGSVSFFRASHC